MSLTGTWNLHTRSQHKQKCPLCDLVMKDVNDFTCPLVLSEESSDLDQCSRPDAPADRICSFSPVKNRACPVSFYLCANGPLVSWFLMMADSSIFWSKNANLFILFRPDYTRDIPFPERTVPKIRHDSSQKIRSLSVNHAQKIGSPPSVSGNSGNSYARSSENSPNRLSKESGSSPDVSDLFNLQSEDGGWISDWKSSSPFSTKSDSSTEASDYLDSLLSLEEEEDREWISFSGSKTELEYFDFPSLCCELVSSAEDLLQTQDMERVITDEPLFWPFQEEFNWDSEQSWTSFCISPRKHINLLGSTAKSSASKLVAEKLKPRKGLVFGKQNGDEAECRSKPETPRRSTLCTSRSTRTVPREVPLIKPLSAAKNPSRKDIVLNRVVPSEKGYSGLDRELPIETLVGLQGFDGHEGIDSECNGNVLILDE